MMTVTDPSRDFEPPPQVDKSLEEEVAAEWRMELADLFSLWDIDNSGFLETSELGRVVALYRDEPWYNWSQKQRDNFVGTFMKWFDAQGPPDGKFNKQEFI